MEFLETFDKEKRKEIYFKRLFSAFFSLSEEMFEDEQEVPVETPATVPVNPTVTTNHKP